MNFVSKIKENPLLSFLIFLLIVAFVTFVGVLFFDCVEDYVSCLIGVTTKNEILKFLGIGMGGILVALQALASHRRAKAMEDTAKTQVDAANAQADAAKAQARATEEQAKANLHTEQGLRQERLKNAIEHLGDEKEFVRLGGAYELFHLAKDAKEDAKELRQTVLDILCAHIRQTTGKEEYKKNHESKPSVEIQSLLTLVFVQEHKVFKGLHINLQESYLNKADLRGARLANAILTKAHLQGVSLRKAHLQGSNLFETYLQEADLRGVHLQGANLSRAHLQGANLRGAYLQGSNLSRAYLQGANLNSAYLQGAGKVNWSSYMSFRIRIRNQIGKESDLSDVVFAGGLKQKDLDALVEGLSDRKANELREEREPHVDRAPSNELPEDSEAITGIYEKEDAEQWITVHEKSMPKVSEDNS